MDDLLQKHAELVGEANIEHAAALRDLREHAETEIRAKISAFGNTMLELVKAADAAREKLWADLVEIEKMVKTEAATAFDTNIAAICLSAGEYQREAEARLVFLQTGKLPVEDPLPKPDAAQPDAANDRQEPPVEEAA